MGVLRQMATSPGTYKNTAPFMHEVLYLLGFNILHEVGCQRLGVLLKLI